MSRSPAPWITRRSIALYWFRETPNIGDAISPVVVERMLGVEPHPVPSRLGGKLLATGSVLGSARPGDWILGSGLLDPTSSDVPSALRVYATRGPLTESRLGRGSSRPSRYGDPATLLPHLIPRPSTRPDNGGTRIGLIPHYVDRRPLRDYPSDADGEVVRLDVRLPVRPFLETLWTCDVVISSSLHGIILAEAYGIPAVWLEPVHEMIGGDFKFRDYYEGTGRSVPAPSSVGAAMEIACSEPPVFQPDTSMLIEAHELARNDLNELWATRR